MSQQGSAPSEQPKGEGNERSPHIPRERFDQVNNERKQLAEQVPQLASQVQQLQQFVQRALWSQQQVPQQAPQQVSPAGMVQPQPQPQAPRFDLSDEAKVKEWQTRIANGGVKELAAFVKQLIEAEGTPLLEQFQQRITSQLTPIQQSYVNQVVDRYAATRQQDPTFQAVRPYFQSFLERARQERPDLPLNEYTLSTIEHMARVQAQQDAQRYGITQFPQPQPGFAPQPQVPQPYQPYQPYQPQVPYSERPGAAGVGSPALAQRQLTEAERQVARGFGMSDAEYLTYSRGV